MTNNSPYSASITGCTFKLEEFRRVLPLLLDDNSAELLKAEADNNHLLQVDSLNSTKRFIAEFQRRFDAVNREFWLAFSEWDETAQRAGFFYAILKTYQLVYDFHINLAVKKFRSVDKELKKGDVMMEFYEIADNATHRFKVWLAAAFGEDTVNENLNFIEKCLNKTVDDYFVKDFWKDHKKMYQNRPIYWLFSSAKGAFQCLAYMHRMDAFTPERIRTKYLLPHLEWLKQQYHDLDVRTATLSTRERKQMDSLAKQIQECQEYHDILHVVADDHDNLAFDLDDGVVVNYAKFAKVLAKIK